MTYHFLYSKISYGDAIHLARAMANTFDSTYFDVYDGCLQESDPRSSKALEQKILVFPNPSNGLVHLNLPFDYFGKLTVLNSFGTQINEENVSSTYVRSINISDQSGIYFLNFISQKGESKTFKVIVHK